MPTKISEYKGHPILSLLKDENDARPFTFGLTKAKLIIDNIDAIKEFVENNSK
ncbi:MAG: hypothetical protein ACP5M9_02695 [Candidatus Micrarchaeia archaeon]